MALVSGVLRYASSVDPAITDLYVKYTYDDTVSDAPAVVVMHGYQQVASLLPQEVMDRFASAGAFAIAPSMRGRDGASGAPDSGGREIHDIVDAVTYLRSLFPAHLSSDRATVAGYSGGGGNAMALACKFPDFFTNVASHFGMSNYATWDEYSGVDVRNAWIGGTPEAVPERYAARNAQAAVTNYSGGFLYLFHDRQDAAVNVDQSETVSTLLQSAGHTNFHASYTDVGESPRWLHGYPVAAQSPDLHLTEDLWLADTIARRQAVWSVPESGALHVIGYLVTKRFSVWLGDGTEHEATVTYDGGVLHVAPSASCDVTVVRDDWVDTRTVSVEGADFAAFVEFGVMGDAEVSSFVEFPIIGHADAPDDAVPLVLEDVGMSYDVSAEGSALLSLEQT